MANTNDLSVRGNIFTGTVVSAKGNKTVKVMRILTKYVPKYERYKKVKSTVLAHDPENKVKQDDIVRIGETRKISKRKSFVVLEVLKKEEEKK